MTTARVEVHHAQGCECKRRSVWYLTCDGCNRHVGRCLVGALIACATRGEMTCDECWATRTMKRLEQGTFASPEEVRKSFRVIRGGKS